MSPPKPLPAAQVPAGHALAHIGRAVRSNHKATTGTILLVIFILIALFPGVIAHASPTQDAYPPRPGPFVRSPPRHERIAAGHTGGRYNPNTDSWIVTSTTGAPSARAYHTAVWSGSEMIVWGAYNGTNLNTGGRYNPGTDSWTATSTANAPTGRERHTAVWTGSEMIVWGGYNGYYLNTGGRYNPSTDSWTATSTTNAPSARYRHTAVWAGSEMIVWGGYAGCCGDVNTGGRYNPSTDSWAATEPSSSPLHDGSPRQCGPAAK